MAIPVQNSCAGPGQAYSQFYSHTLAKDKPEVGPHSVHPSTYTKKSSQADSHNMAQRQCSHLSCSSTLHKNLIHTLVASHEGSSYRAIHAVQAHYNVCNEQLGPCNEYWRLSGKHFLMVKINMPIIFLCLERVYVLF